MRYQIAAETAADVTLSVTLPLEKTLSPTALAVFRALHQVAVEVAEARGYHANVGEVELFCPAEQVAQAVGVSRASLYRALPQLVEAGLVDFRGHKTTLRGRTRADGTCWSVRLRPVGGRAARLSYDALKRQYRDLGGDIKAGRTSWALLRQSKDNSSSEVDLSLIRRWSLPPSPTKTPLSLDRLTAARRSLESVLDVPHVERGERSAAVSLAAEALSAALRDRGAVNFYRRLMWQLLRRRDASGDAPFQVVYEQARRAAAESSEGYGRRPGALLVSRLKRASWWSEVMTAPPTRVGSRPVEA